MSTLGEAGLRGRLRVALLALAAIVTVALVLRVYDLRGNPPGFFCDEASIGYNAYLVVHTGADQWGVRFPIYFRAFGEYKNPIFIYASMPLVALMGLDPLATRLTAALFGTATVILMYPLALELFRRRNVALLSAASLAIAPWHLLFSRVAFEAISMPFFYELATLTFLVALRRHSPRLYLANFALWGLSIYTYSVARLLTPLLLLSLLLIYCRETWRWRRYTIAGLAIFVVCMIPLAQAIASGAATARFGLIGVFSRGLLAWDLIGTIAQLYVQHFSALYLFTFGSRPGDLVLRNYIPGMGALYWAQLPLVMVGLAALLARRDRPALLILAWLLLYPTGGTLTEGPSQLRDLFGVLPFNLITGYGAAEAWRWLRHAAPRACLQPLVTAVGTVMGVAVLALSLAQLWNLFYVQYPRTTAGYWGWQVGPSAIIAYFKRVEPLYDDLFMTGSFNSPEIFIPFYASTGCQRCAIGGLDRYNPARRQLFALRPEEMVPGFHYLIRRTLYYGDGTVAFRIVELRR
jgi:4-amino-4-deoxy-L-arabinose transferase-like glycosyltransferase